MPPPPRFGDLVCYILEAAPPPPRLPGRQCHLLNRCSRYPRRQSWGSEPRRALVRNCSRRCAMPDRLGEPPRRVPPPLPARGGTPTRPRPPEFDAEPMGSRSIRRRGGDCPAAAMHADVSACPRGDDGPAVASVAAAREEGVSGGVAIAVSARIHPVPRFATAGVEASAALPTSADAELAPARRRITGKQRAAVSHCTSPSAVVASDPHCRRYGALQLGRARTERPPG